MLTADVLVLTGPPCSGKSSVARRLVQRAGPDRRVLVGVDAVFDLLLPASDRNQADRMLAYDAAHGAARSLLLCGVPVVLECTYSRAQQRVSLLHALEDLGAPLRGIEFLVQPDEAVRRFGVRHQETDLDELLVREKALAFPYWGAARQVDSSIASPDGLCDGIVAWLDGEPASVPATSWAAAGR